MKHYIDQVLGTNGAVIAGALVTVRVKNTSPGTGALATIYSDDGVTLVAGSVLTTDITGTFSFWAPDGKYDLVCTVAGFTKIVADVEIADLTESNSGDSGAVLSSLNNIQIVGQGSNTNFAATATAMGGTGGAIVPPSYAGTDSMVVNSNGPVTIDFRPNPQGSLGLWHGIHAMHPVLSGATGFPGGNDLPIDVWGPGDIIPACNPIQTTCSTTIAPGTTVVTIGACTDLGGKGSFNGNAIQCLSHNTSVQIILEPGTANEEVIPFANWSIVDGTHLSITAAKSHTQPYTIWQRGVIQLVTDSLSVTGVLGLSHVIQESAGTYLHNMAGLVGIRPAGDISVPTQALDVHGPAIGASFAGLTIGDAPSPRINIGYSTSALTGTKLVAAQIQWGNVAVAGDLEIGSRGNQPTRIAFYTSPDTGTTGLVNNLQINPTGTIQFTKNFSSYNGITTADFGVPTILGTPQHLTAQTANLGATNIVAAALVGTYKIYYSARTTTSGSGTTATVSIIWTDEGGVKTFTSPTWALNSVTSTGEVDGVKVIHATAASNIQVSTTGTFGTSVYALDAWAERVQ